MNLLVNGGFEDAPTAGNPCGLPWSFFQGSGARDTTARSGAYACRVCALGAQSYTADYGGGAMSPAIAAGTKLTGRAWVRALPGVTTNEQLLVSVRIYGDGGTADHVRGASASIGQTWAPVDVQLTTSGAGVLNVYVEADPTQSGECFLVDDVSVVAN